MEYIKIKEEELEKLEQFIRGSLLGDGCVTKLYKETRNSSIAWSHCPEQLEYLKWKVEYLKQFSLNGAIHKYHRVAKRFIKGFCNTWHSKSKSHPIFTKFRKLYYPNNKKLIVKEDIIKLNEFGLAIWYMDDGSIWNRKNRSSCLVLYTNGFMEEDVKFLIKLLWDKWGILSSYYKHENSIRISSNYSQKFINLVNPYIVDCLKYKTELVKTKKYKDEL